MARVEVPIFKDGKWDKGFGESVNIVEQKEPWAEYHLEDGTIIRMKQTVLQVVKMDELDLNGKPVYTMQTQPSTVIMPKV
jgi:hypothetical protein